MTVVDSGQQREQTQPPSEPRNAAANRDLAREHGNHVAHLADIAEDCLDEADFERVTRTQYEDGLQVLSFLIGADWPERTLEIDRVLHDEHGSLSVEKTVEFIDLLLAGRSSMQARQIMQARAPHRAERVQSAREAVARGREVSANLHSLAEAPVVRMQPALPPAGAAPMSNGALPRREPIAPPPPMVPPAPPESPAEQTGQIIAALRGNGYLISSDMEAAARKDGKSGLAVAPPDPAYAVTAIPAQRHLSDTVEFRADQVLASLAADDASQEMVADGPVERAGERVEPLPFAEAAVSAAPGSRPESASEASDD